MLTGILTTNGGAHSPKKWAYASASMLLDWFKIDPNSPRGIDLEMAKDGMRPAIAGILIKHHEAIQKLEQVACKKDDGRSLLPDHTLEVREHVDIDIAVDEIFKIVEPLLERAQLFVIGITNQPDMKPYVKGVIYDRISTDLRTSMKIERGYHASHMGLSA